MHLVRQEEIEVLRVSHRGFINISVVFYIQEKGAFEEGTEKPLVFLESQNDIEKDDLKIHKCGF